MCARSACVVVDEVSEENFLAAVREKGKYFEKQLKKLVSTFPIAKEVRGKGLMLGFEVPEKQKKLLRRCSKRSFVNACNDDVVRFLPL